MWYLSIGYLAVCEYTALSVGRIFPIIPLCHLVYITYLSHQSSWVRYNLDFIFEFLDTQKQLIHEYIKKKKLFFSLHAVQHVGSGYPNILQWKCWVLTTGPPGNSPKWGFFLITPLVPRTVHISQFLINICMNEWKNNVDIE